MESVALPSTDLEWERMNGIDIRAVFDEFPAGLLDDQHDARLRSSAAQLTQERRRQYDVTDLIGPNDQNGSRLMKGNRGPAASRMPRGATARGSRSRTRRIASVL